MELRLEVEVGARFYGDGERWRGDDGVCFVWDGWFEIEE